VLNIESRLGSQLRASKRKNAPVTPVHSSHKLQKMSGTDRTAASENNPHAVQQTVVCIFTIASFLNRIFTAAIFIDIIQIYDE
jgi:hypothetical protein